MTEFITKSLGELTSIMTKGIAPKYVEEESNSTIVVLNQKCNRDFSISLEQSRLNDCNKKAVSPERMLHKYDVLINSTGTGTAGRVAQLFNIPEPMTIDGHMILIRPTDEIDPIYYGYAVKAHQAEIEMLAEGSTGQTEINRKRLSSEIMISFPVNIESQKQIGELLYQIDQKIWTNTAINDNLQQQAQAIYHEHFESVKSGNLPSEWRIVKLGEIALISKQIFNPSKEPETMLEHYSIPAFDEAKFPVFEPSTTIKSNKYIIDKDCCLISKLNPTTKRVWKPYCLSNNAVCSTEFVVYKAKDNNITDFIFAVIDSLSFSDFMCSHVTGSTGSRQRTTPSDTLAFELFLPSKKEMADFQATVAPIYTQMQVNAIINDNLKRLRDTLLPKLISGEVDVSSIDL